MPERESLTGLPGYPASPWFATADILLAVTQLPFDPTLALRPVRDTPMPVSERAGIARELLVSLTQVTGSGQRHVMCRVLEIVRGDILRSSVRLTPPQVVAVMQAVTELQHEAARTAPDLALFRASAGLVIDILEIA